MKTAVAFVLEFGVLVLMLLASIAVDAIKFAARETVKELNQTDA